MTEHFDLIALGSGSAARDAAKKASSEYGARAALVERERWGGGCPNIACRPTKAYLVAADLIHDVNTLAPTIGIDVGAARPRLSQIREWKRSLQRPQESWLEVLARSYETVSGEARFRDARTITVGDRVLAADRILIATGSRTAVPAIPGIDEVDWLDHVSALELTEVPESLLVLGGGPVGLEFGQIFARFGSRVTIVNGGPHMAGRFDRDAAETLQAALEEEGIELVHEARASRVQKGEAGVIVTLEPGGTEIAAERLLLASGRAINIEELDLAAAGVDHTPRAIAVDQYLRTNVDGIWAAGDVTGIQFTPTAQYQARIAVDDMFGNAAAPADYTYLPTAIFTDPEIAGVGLTETAASEQGFDVDAVVHPLEGVTRAQFIGAKHGLFKVVFDLATRRVLGVHAVTRGASDVVQGLGPGLKLGATIEDLALAHHAYPTYGEGVKAAAEKALVSAART